MSEPPAADTIRTSDAPLTVPGADPLYRELFFSHPSPLALLDAGTLQVVEMNREAGEFFGIAAPQATLQLDELVSFADPAAWQAFLAAPGSPWSEFAATLVRNNRTPLSLKVRRAEDAPGRLFALFTPVQEDSASNGVYASIFTHAGIGLTVVDTSMRILSMNPTIRSWFPQIDPAEHPYCYQSFNTPPLDAPCSYCPVVQVLEDGQPHRATSATPTPEGIRHYSMIATPLLDAQGEIASIVETAEDVTDRMLLEQRVLEKSRNLQAVLDNAPIAIWYKDVAGRFRFVNKTFCRQIGIPEERLLEARHFSELLPEQMAATCAVSDAVCLKEGGPCTSREHFPFSDGKEHLLSVTKGQVRSDEGEVLGVVGLGIDITEQQLYAARLEILTKNFLRFGPDFNANINILTEVAGRLLGARWAAFNLLEQGELHSLGCWNVPEGFATRRSPEGSCCHEVLSSGSSEPVVVADLAASPFAGFFKEQLAAGITSYLGIPVCWGERTVGVLCTLFDHEFHPTAADLSFASIIAAALAIEEDRRSSVLSQQRSERLYRTLFSEAVEGVFMMTTDGVILEVNQAFANMHGYRCEEMAGMRLATLDTPRSLERAPGRIARLLAGEHLTFEVEHYHRDGHTFSLEVSSSLLECDGEHRLICFHRDITERKRHEEALRKSEHEFRLLAEAMPQMVWICGANGENLYTNENWMRYTGMSLESSRGGGWQGCFHPDDLETAWESWQRAAQGFGEYTIEARLGHRDGSYRWFLVRGVPVRDDAGTLVKWFGTCTDIDDLKRAEEERRTLEKQFQQAQKLESLGVLAGGVAHDFNNILAIISGYCSLLALEPERCPDYLPEITNATERATELCRQMLAYAGKTQFAMSIVDLTFLVEDMVRMLKATLPQNVQIRLDRPQENLVMIADAGQLRQVLMNLIINASEAIGALQGEITVSLQRTRLAPGAGGGDHLGKEIPAGSYLCLEVTDTGCGMDEETRLRVFEPFFSTKFSGRGLGMSAVLGIVNAHGGALRIESTPGTGTSFRIYLPPPEETASGVPAGQQPAATPAWQGSGRVLLVEDEKMVRGLAATMLKKLGFEVVEAQNGAEGLGKFQQGDAAFRLVITDLGMPVMDGYQLVQELKRLAPELPILITTGFGEVDVASRLTLDRMDGFLAKPYDFVKLREAVNRLVEAAG
ncbi:hypothetical protein GMLC_05120 [Geomonas limicola]|uniref:histidine kinase n=1 Tax=Geomonas limicola TaxID=2740186 RepID=A0A6V8N5N7_9BACT|nr:PAS domain S-box protein [Geomonas limicola]GFO66933.1 hypothetical protein GMLC_05120 [Geomonas limicola]